MNLRTTLLTIGALGALAAPSTAFATSWTAPVTIDTASRSNPIAVGALGGGVLDGWLDHSVSASLRNGDAFGPLTPISAADPSEKVWAYAAAPSGTTTVLTVRRHKPTQRIRATTVGTDGTHFGPVTISDRSHSASAPMLDVAADGTAVAAWQWHDPAGWRVQAAIRRPGQARFDKPQNISPATPAVGRNQVRPWIHVAAGPGGRGVVTWQIGGSADLPESPLHVLTAGTDGVFGADQALAHAGGLADVALAIGPGGDVQLAYADEHFSGNEGPMSLHVANGPAGGVLSDPAILSTGGRGLSDGSQVAAAYSQDATATVAWAKPGDNFEQGGVLEVFTRAPGGAFGAAQTLAAGAQGLTLAGGPGASAALSWMRGIPAPSQLSWTVHAVTRPAAGGAFSPDETISATDRNALWPSIAMTAAGDAIDTWVTNTDGSGGGQIAAAVHHAT